MRPEESRPAGNRAASKMVERTEAHGSTELAGLAPLDALAEHVDGAFVVVVRVTGGRYRRRCFLSAASAQRAADRALARGENATVYLAELKPLYRLTGGAR